MEQFSISDLGSLLLASLLGAVVGFDRDYRGKSAGYRTLMMVSLGAAVFTVVSQKLALTDPHHQSDVSRIASTVVTGIGFLGAGIIYKSGQDIKGLTTAATTWVAAGIGMACGTQEYILAATTTAISLLTLFVLHRFEAKLGGVNFTEKYRLTWQNEKGDLPWPEQYCNKGLRLSQQKFSKQNELIIVEWTIRASKAAHAELTRNLLTDPRVLSLEH